MAERVIDGFYIPDVLFSDEATRKYVEIMKEFEKENRMKLKGVMGSYCAGGQMSFALQVALRVQNPRVLRESTLDDLVV